MDQNQQALLAIDIQKHLRSSKRYSSGMMTVHIDDLQLIEVKSENFLLSSGSMPFQNGERTRSFGRLGSSESEIRLTTSMLSQ